MVKVRKFNCTTKVVSLKECGETNRSVKKKTASRNRRLHRGIPVFNNSETSHITDRNVTYEAVYGINCDETDTLRNDSLLKCSRHEDTIHSNGTKSKDIHVDKYCLKFDSCSHTVVRTELVKKEMKFKKCTHSIRPKLDKVTNTVKVYEGLRLQAGEPNVSVSLPHFFDRCDKCEMEINGGRTFPKLQPTQTQDLTIFMKALVKQYRPLEKNRPTGSFSVRQLFELAKSPEPRQVAMRADLLHGRHGDNYLKHRKIVNVYYYGTNCRSEATIDNVVYHARTEEATWYDGTEVSDIHRDTYCAGRPCLHLNYSIKTTTKEIFYSNCNHGNFVTKEITEGYCVDQSTTWETTTTPRVLKNKRGCPICKRVADNAGRNPEEHIQRRHNARRQYARKQ